MSLFDDLGVNYSADVFNGAWFKHPETGAACVVRALDEGAVHAHIRTTATRFQRSGAAVTTVLPHEAFPDWKAFSYPPLGYREDHTSGTLFYATKRPSVRRGLHPSDIHLATHDVSFAIAHVRGRAEPSAYGLTNSPNIYMPLIMEPVFTKFSAGLAGLMNGDLPFFALSPEFAVAPDDSVSGALILYRRRPIGTISPEGKVSMTISNDHISKLWEVTTRG